MDKQQFIAEYVAKNFPAAKPGMRVRGAVSDAVKAQKAEAAYAEFMQPNRIKARELVAAGGKLWDGERVYFNAVPVGDIGRTEDVYFNIETGTWVGHAEAVAKIAN